METRYLEEQQQLHHFHFTCTQLYEDFCEMTEHVIKESLRPLEDMLVAKIPTDTENIREEVKNLEEVYIIRSRGPLQKFKEAANEIFSLGPVNLNDTKLTPEEFESLKREVKELEQKYLEEVYYRSLLKKELQKIESVQPMYEEVNKVVKRMEKYRLKPGEKSLKDLQDVAEKIEDFFYAKLNNQNSDVSDVFGLFKKQGD